MNTKIDERSDGNPLNQNKGVGINENKVRKEGVVKGIRTTSIIGLIILIVIGIVFYSMYKREHMQQLNLMENQKTALTGQITARDSVINEWISTFDEIEKNLAMIKEKEKIITMNSSDRELSKERKDQVIEDIRYINTLLEQNKKKIASLNAQLKKSGGTIKALQNKITELEASIKQSETDIQDLKTSLAQKDVEIEQLNTQVTGMQTTINLKDEKINDQTEKINTAYFVSGTYKELKAKGLVTKEGGFIGLGKKEALLENFSDSAYTKINILETKTIPVNSKKAKLITEHPSGSYEFVRNNNDDTIEYVEISNPEQFWKISKYAVLEITR